MKVQIDIALSQSDIATNKISFNYNGEFIRIDYTEEDYSNFYSQLESDLNPPSEEEKFYEQEMINLSALMSPEGLKKSLSELNWINKVGTILEITTLKYPGVFTAKARHTIHVQIEILDYSINFDKLKISADSEILQKYGIIKIGSFNIYGKNLIELHSIKEIELSKLANIDKLNIKHLDVNQINILGRTDGLSLSGGKIGELNWKLDTDDDLKNKSTSLCISGCLIDKLKIASYGRDKVLFHKLGIVSTEIKSTVFLTGLGINKEPGLFFENCRFLSESRLLIVESDIRYLKIKSTHIQFSRISDSSVDNLIMSRSNLGTCELEGITGTGFYDIKTSKNSTQNYIEIKEYYRRLKHTQDSIGNKTEANKFFAKEMEYYRKSLGMRDWDKKIISLVQEFSNGYGNNWIRPLGWIFSLSAIKTYLNGFSIHFDSLSIFWKELLSFSEKLVLNINLIDDFKEISNPIELIYRILLAFFIYQFLIALRRISQR